MSGPVILVGLRLDGQPDYRRRNWEYARSRWEAQVGWPIVEGHYDEDPFSLARASNRAAALAGDWKVALYVGADFLLASAAQAEDAVERAVETGKLAFAHDVLTQLDGAETDALISAGPTGTPAGAGTRHPNTFSGALAVTRSLWDDVGGFDERFVDWGWDDLAFWASCCALGGGFERVAGEAFHLWHPRSREENEGNPHHSENQVLGTRYLAAKSDPAATRAIIAERV